jgi:hypothetical protein
MVTPAALGAAICAMAEPDAKTARAKTDRVFISNTLSAFFDEADDKRFLVALPLQSHQNANTPITVVLNWLAGLKK